MFYLVVKHDKMTSVISIYFLLVNLVKLEANMILKYIKTNLPFESHYLIKFVLCFSKKTNEILNKFMFSPKYKSF